MAKTNKPSTPGDVLVQALVANPDDRAAHAAYADWLSEQGDPRGEFIQVQLALEDPRVAAKDRKTLQDREKKLLKAHYRDWLGGLAVFLPKPDKFEDWGSQYSFARGWLHTLTIVGYEDGLAENLAHAHELRLLDTFVLEEEYILPEVDWARAGAHLANVRVLQFGGPPHEVGVEFYYNFPPDFGSLAPLVRPMHRLEELYFDGRVSDIEKIVSLPNLTKLRRLQYCFADNYPIEALAKNKALGNLQWLLLHPQSNVPDEFTPHLELADIRTLLRSKNLPRLDTLQLHMTTMGDEGCEEIVRSGILKRLKVLDLAYGNVTDEGARILAKCPDFRNLEMLVVARNALTENGFEVLEATGVKLGRHGDDDQHHPDDPGYLFEGSME